MSIIKLERLGELVIKRGCHQPLHHTSWNEVTDIRMVVFGGGGGNWIQEQVLAGKCCMCIREVLQTGRLCPPKLYVETCCDGI